VIQCLAEKRLAVVRLMNGEETLVREEAGRRGRIWRKQSG